VEKKKKQAQKETKKVVETVFNGIGSLDQILQCTVWVERIPSEIKNVRKKTNKTNENLLISV
jgi:hypothetical protein